MKYSSNWLIFFEKQQIYHLGISIGKRWNKPVWQGLSISAERKNEIILHRVINLIYEEEDSTCSFAPHTRRAIEFSNSRSSRVSIPRPVGHDRSVFGTWCASVTRYRVRITVEEFLFRDRRDTRRIRVSVNGWELHSLRVLLLGAPPRFDRFPIRWKITGCFAGCIFF